MPNIALHRTRPSLLLLHVELRESAIERTEMRAQILATCGQASRVAPPAEAGLTITRGGFVA